MSKKLSTLIFLLITILLLSSTIHAQLCVPNNYAPSARHFYNVFTKTWSYLGPCSNGYNCLAYSFDITDQWIWPWGADLPTATEVDSYLKAKGYSKSGDYPKIISYGQTDKIKHFSKVIDSSVCQAKCGGLNLLQHSFWDAYPEFYGFFQISPWGLITKEGYGSLHSVYYKSLSVIFPVPFNAHSGSNIALNAFVYNGAAPYTYNWSMSPNNTLCSDPTQKSFSFLMPDNDIRISVAVTDANGFSAYYSYIILVNNRRSRKGSTEAELMLSNHISELEFSIADTTSSSNPYDYINNDGFRKIVKMGPEVLETIKNRIKSTKENGLMDYILAIAAEKIAAVDLKTVSEKWETGSGWVFSWGRFLTELPAKVDAILYSSEPSDEKNRQIEALGFAALPILEDRINNGATELNLPMKNLISKYKNMPADSNKRNTATSTAEMIETYRNLLNQAK